MSNRSRNRGHHQYKSRITHLFKFYEDSEPEAQAHNAKYLAVLVSGYLEQAVKEMLLHYTSEGARAQISKYVEKTWPISRNMKVDSIEAILNQFESKWGEEFQAWVKGDDKRRGHINSIVEWRNSIAHGQESNTHGVTLVSVRAAFSTVVGLVALLENMIK